MQGKMMMNRKDMMDEKEIPMKKGMPFGKKKKPSPYAEIFSKK